MSKIKKIILDSSRPGANIPFCFDDMLKSCCHLFIVKRSKPKSCAARLQSWDYLGQVVTNQTEPCVLCKFLHYCNAKHIKKQCQYSIKHHTYMY